LRDWSRELQKSPNGLAAVKGSATEFIEQLGGGPRRLTSLVPLRQDSQGHFVVERKASRQPAADAEGVNVAMLSRNGWRHGRQVSLRALDYAQIDGVHFSAANKWLERCGASGWEVAWPEPSVDVAVLNCYQVRSPVLMIQEPG
jgi:hypothetical protein